MNITLEEVSEYLEGFHKYGGYGMAICIFHSDHSPSLRLSEHGYKCMSCGAKGSLAYLYEKVSGRIVSREPKKYNPAQKIWYTWTEKYGSVQNIAKLAHQELRNNPERGHYLKQRKIDSQIIPGKLGFLDGYYTFPVRNEYDEVTGIVARASPTIQTKDLRYTVSHNSDKLYVPNWRKVLKDESLYLCYGTLDAWTLVMAGYAGLTGISGQEFEASNLLRFRKPIYIIPDKNEEKNALTLQCRLDWRGKMLLIDWPEGTKDLNQIHMDYGLDVVSGLIEKAKEKYNYD